MAPFNELAENPLYIDYSIPLKNSLAKETEMKRIIQYKESIRSNKASRTSRKIRKLSSAIRTFLVISKVDDNIDDFDELKDSIHLSKQRIKSRQLDSGTCCAKEVASYLDRKDSTQIKKELTDNVNLNKRRILFPGKLYNLRANAA